MRKITSALAWSGLGRSMPIHSCRPARAPEEHTFVCELWPSTPQAASTRSVNPSSPGRPTWYMISLLRPSTIAGADAAGDGVERLVPRDLGPSPCPASSDAAQRVQDAVGVLELVERGRPLRAVPPTGTGRIRVAFELAHLHRLSVHVRQQAARRLAVEARRRDQHVVALGALRPVSRVQLHPIVPSLPRRVRRQVAATGAGVERLAAGFGAGPRCRHPFAAPTGVVGLAGPGLGLASGAHASGTDWPACT